MQERSSLVSYFSWQVKRENWQKLKELSCKKPSIVPLLNPFSTGRFALSLLPLLHRCPVSTLFTIHFSLFWTALVCPSFLPFFASICPSFWASFNLVFGHFFYFLFAVPFCIFYDIHLFPLSLPRFLQFCSSLSFLVGCPILLFLWFWFLLSLFACLLSSFIVSDLFPLFFLFSSNFFPFPFSKFNKRSQK